MTALIVSSMNIFPSDSILFSDFDLITKIEEGTDPAGIIGYILFPAEDGYDIFAVILTTVGIVGTVVGFATKNISVVMVGLTVTLFSPLIGHSSTFFRTLFTTWDVTALTYLGVAIAVGIAATLIITLLETPTHGKSGE